MLNALFAIPLGVLDTGVFLSDVDDVEGPPYGVGAPTATLPRVGRTPSWVEDSFGMASCWALGVELVGFLVLRRIPPLGDLVLYICVWIVFIWK